MGNYQDPTDGQAPQQSDEENALSDAEVRRLEELAREAVPEPVAASNTPEVNPFSNPSVHSEFLEAFRRYGYAATDASAEYIEAAALECLAGITMKHKQRANGHRPNFFLILCGPSTDRKTAALSLGREIVGKVVPERMFPGDFTAEGLMRRVVDRRPGEPLNDTLLIFDPEHSSAIAKMQSYKVGLDTDLCRYYDGGFLDNARATKSKVVKLPEGFMLHVTLIAACAEGMFQGFGTERLFSGGYLARTILLNGNETRRPQIPIKPDVSSSLAHHKDVCYAKLWTLNEKIKSPLNTQLMLTPQARTTLLGVIDILNKKREEVHPGLRAYIARSAINVEKLSILYQMDIDPFAPISQAAMLAAWKIVEIGIKSGTRLWNLCSGSEGSQAMTRIYQAMERAGGKITRQNFKRTALRACGNIRDLDAVIKGMLDCGMIIKTPRGFEIDDNGDGMDENI